MLSGGSTLFKGFGDRLLSEIKKMSPKEIQIKVSKINSFTKEMAVWAVSIVSILLYLIEYLNKYN